MSVPISALPEHDRPRERLFSRGAGALSDQELLAVVLRSGTRGASATDVAASLLRDHGGLRGLASAKPEELSVKVGVGLAKATALVAAFELGRRADQPDEAIVIRSADDVARVARLELDGQRRERVLVLICDASNRLRQTAVVSDGSIDHAIFPVREIMNAVLRHDGKAFAVAHNHPSGSVEPSSSDVRITGRVRAAADTVGLRFLGHVILGRGTWCPVG